MEKKKLSLPKQIGIALLLGILAGYAFYMLGIPEFTTNYLKPFGTIFVNLLKFIVVPVVLLSMIDGIISMGDMKKVGSVGWKTVAYFLVTTAAACVIGLFPLYADGIPAVLMRTLKELAVWRGTARPRIHVLVNCGFLEPEQTRPAVEMVRFFCKRYGFPWGMALQIGSGEAILNTPFSFLVRRGLRRLAAGMRAGRSEVLSVRMPLNRRMFVWASGRYWTDYGAKNNITAGEMRTMEIEGG